MKNFTLSLFAFHLRQGLTDAPDQRQPNADDLWKNLVKLGETEFRFPCLKDLQSKYLLHPNEEDEGKEWLTRSQQTLELGSLPTSGGFKIKGDLQPFRLHDIYAVDLTLLPEDRNLSIAPSHLKQFKPYCLLPSRIGASLGQTLWLYGEVEETENPQELAKSYTTALLEETSFHPILVDQDDLLGSPFFEYCARDPEFPQDSTREIRIFVSLNTNQAQTLKSLEKAYNNLLHLLCCYHKIRYVYQQGRDRCPNARQLYSQLETRIQEFPQLNISGDRALDKLKVWLREIPGNAITYNRYLRDLEAHQTAIVTNTINYRTCLKNIKEIGEVPVAWHDFLKKCYQWQTQIKTDLNYLSPGQTLFEQLTSAVRGTVEIERAKRENQLQRTLFAIGSGLTVGGIVASSSGKITPENPLYIFCPSDLICQPHSVVVTIFWSIVFSLVTATITFAIIGIWQQGSYE